MTGGSCAPWPASTTLSVVRWVFPGLAPLAVTAAALLGLASGPSVDTSPADPAPVAYVPPAGSVQANILALVNRQRAQHGCGAVTVNRALVTSARRHNGRMAATSNLTHTVPGEPRLLQRVKSAGYTRPAIIAENIAYGYTSASGVIGGWMRSSLHRGILLDCRLRHIGVSKINDDGLTWWTLDVGRRR